MSTFEQPVIDAVALRERVQEMYREVAEQPGGDFHFETGRAVAERLGYPAAWLDAVAPDALASFAGVGHMLDLAAIKPGETVLDLGSGSGTDAFIAALLTGPQGSVVGVDMTDAQLAKARHFGARIAQATFVEGLIEEPPVGDECIDVVISNGVINLSVVKNRVFAEAARVLRPGGRLAVADIVTEQQLTDAIVCNAELWAACIGGAAQQDTYRALIESAGMVVREVRRNDYAFISDQARGASARYGVKSISLLATKT
jgi:SAM-dependent methyltransferase